MGLCGAAAAGVMVSGAALDAAVFRAAVMAVATVAAPAPRFAAAAVALLGPDGALALAAPPDTATAAAVGTAGCGASIAAAGAAVGCSSAMVAQAKGRQGVRYTSMPLRVAVLSHGSACVCTRVAGQGAMFMSLAKHAKVRNDCMPLKLAVLP